MFFEFVLLLAVVGVLFYTWATANNDFFKKRGIPFHKPTVLLGNMADIILKKDALPDTISRLYKAHDGKVYGIFDQRTPIFLVRDPELLKHIGVKDFDHFMNHRPQFKADADTTDATQLFGRSVFALENNTWREMRTTLSPAFTGSKMRQMFQLINETAEQTGNYLKEQPEIKSGKGKEIELKDFCTRFTNDVIASAAFGIQVNSLKDKDNEFYSMGKRVTNFTAWQNLKVFIAGNFKKIFELLGLKLFSKKDSEYFMRLVLDAMKYRKDNNIVRPDMINMLMEARGDFKSEHGKSPRNWSDIDLVAQCFIFFFAGFETVSVLMCFVLHELMENPDIQQRLYEEISEVDSELNGKPVTYEALMKMPYMEMVVQETLRKWPAAVVIDRQCNEDYVYEKDGERFEIRKGEIVWIPVWGIHHDPQYYEKPHIFDPERFNEENKSKIDPFIFAPFGIGPRICIGSRFALLEAKALIYYILRDLKVVPGAKTQIPLQLKRGTFQLTAENGFWIKFLPRAKQ